MNKTTFLPPKMMIFIGSMCFFAFSSTAQVNVDKPRSGFWENVRFGGGIGISLGDGYFSGSLAPTAVYQFNEKFAAGVGLNGSYAKQKDVFSSTVLGASVLGLFSPLPELQISAEFEELNINRDFDISGLSENYWYPALFLGLGYNSGNVTVGIRYDVLYDEDKSIYADAYVPFLRVFF